MSPEQNTPVTPLRFGPMALAGAVAGLMVGVVLALVDPAVSVMASVGWITAAELAPLIVQSVAVVVPVVMAAGLVYALGLCLLERICRPLFRLALWMQPFLLILAVFVYYARWKVAESGRLGYVLGAKCALVALVVGGLGYVALRALVRAVDAGRARPVVIAALAAGVVLWVSVLLAVL